MSSENSNKKARSIWIWLEVNIDSKSACEYFDYLLKKEGCLSVEILDRIYAKYKYNHYFNYK